MKKSSAEKQTRRVVIFQAEKCLNCMSCELACSVSHTASRKLCTAVMDGEKPVRRRWMKSAGSTGVSVGCQHCDPAPCVDACISAAMQKGPGVETLHDPEKCVGCWMCVMVCPFGAVKRDENEHKIAKCDLCSCDEVLACVESCPTGALEIRFIKE